MRGDGAFACGKWFVIRATEVMQRRVPQITGTQIINLTLRQWRVCRQQREAVGFIGDAAA